MRKWRTEWATKILQRFSNMAPLARINSAPKAAPSCPIDSSEFATFLRDIFSTANGDYEILPKDLIATIPKFSLDDLNKGLQKMANCRCADEHGIVIEMIKHGSLELKWHILCCFNQYIEAGEFDSDWHQIVFSMLPKTGDLKQVSNWRPTAILPILYKLFARMVYHRISPTLLSKQSRDQFGFTPGVRIDDALMIAECVSSYHIEFNIPVWFVSLDLRKAFDRVDYAALFQALRHCELPDGYIALLQQLYSTQYGSANGSDRFKIERGVKQGHVLTALFIKCILDFAISK